MRSRLVTPRAILALLVLSLLSLRLNASSDPGGDKQKLQKELAKVEKDIKLEERRLSKKKVDVEKEYGRLMKATVQKALSRKARSIGSTWAGALVGPGKAEAIRQIKKELRTVLKAQIGANLATIILSDLTSNLVDRISGVDSIEAEEAVKITIEDLFPEGKFETDFDSIKADLFKRYARLTQKRDHLKSQIKEIERRENALKAGIPPGMLKVPSGKHRIGLNDKDISKTIKLVGAKPEGSIHWWVGSPAHEIELSDFYIDVNEVTNAWYAEFLKDQKDEEIRVPRYWKDGTYPESWGNRPVTDLSHNDARNFARWMGRRLPTEYEWESAARYSQDQKDLRVWPWGTAWDVMKVRCNNDLAIEHPQRRSIPHTLPPLLDVGSFPEGKSALGGNDFAGNAYELTSSTYAPYPGFKGKKINKARLSTADFNREMVVLRGGDCNKRDVVVSTTWRLGIPRTGRAPWVGFRTAASSTRGMDHVRAITEDDAQKRYLVDYAPLPSDLLARRQYSALAADDPSRYSSVITGGFSSETNLPTRARHITLINRHANDFRDHNALRALAKDGPVMLGFVHIGVPVIEPKLEPGNYMICWVNTVVPEPPPEEKKDDAKKDDAKKDKKKKDKKEAPAPDPIPEAFTFIKLGGRRRAPTRMTKFLPPVTAAAQPTRVVPNGSADFIDLSLAFPIKFKKRKAFVVQLRLKLEPGQAAQFK